MAVRKDDNKAGREDSRGGPKTGSGTGRGRPSNDAVVRALAEVEQTLERLKQVRNERAEAEERFKTELADRDRQIEALQTERREEKARLTKLEAKIAAIEAASGASQEQAEAKATGLETERDEVIKKLETLERQLTQTEAILDDERADRALAESKLVLTAEAASSEADTLREQLENAEEKASKLTKAREQELAEAQTAADTLREQFTAAENASKEQVTALHGTIEALEARADEAEHQVAELHSREEETSLQAAEALKHAEVAETQLKEATTRLGTLELTLTTKTGEADEAVQNASILIGKVAEQDAELARLQAELAEAKATADEQQLALTEQDASAESAMAELRSEVERLETEAATLRESCEAATTAATESERQSQAIAAELEALRSESDQHTDAIRAEMGETLEAERERTRELTEKLDMAADRLVELQTALDAWEESAGQDGSQAPAQAGANDEAVAELTSQLDQLREQLAQTELHRDQACRELDQIALDKGHPSEHWDDEQITLRRRRLRRYRSLLREHAQKSAAAEEVLVQRIQMCDEVLSRRRELAEARQIIEKAHKKIASGKARSGAAAAVFFGLAIVTVLSGLSWATVTRLFPPTYAASAVIGADFDGIAPEPGELEAWQTFHEQLLYDPNIMVRVGDRMKQRGFINLSHPTAVKNMLQSDMTWSSPEPSTLVIEMRGQGREATQRKLDTYVTTISTEANALRQRRSESSTTVVLERAKTGAEPIHDERLQQAGIGVAAGTLFCFILWFGLWHRMVKSKAAFENTTEIEGLLEEARWVDPIEQIMSGRDQDGDNRAA